MPRLVLLNPELADRSCDLLDGTWTVGRSRSNHIVIHDGSVSSLHCELLVYGAEVIVRDCGSRNRTFVNGAQVHTQKGVSHGQTLRFGRVEARVEIVLPAYDGSRATTAIDDYRRWLRQRFHSFAQPKPPPLALLPARTDEASNDTQTAPSPPVEPVVISNPPPSRAERLRTFPLGPWIAAGLVLLALIILWLWTK
jgi:pSer/pThr/pTyr-binding forkhead associated (FHA) protein